MCAGDRSGPIVLYDGVCVLCNGLVRFVLARDRAAILRFAPLQSGRARATLARHRRRPEDVVTAVVVADPDLPGERLLERSEAVLFVLDRLPGIWPFAARLACAVPRSVRDWAYDRIAGRRYRVFGQYDVCPVPPPEYRARFLE